MAWDGRKTKDGVQLCDATDCPNPWKETYMQAFFCPEHMKGAFNYEEEREEEGMWADYAQEAHDDLLLEISDDLEGERIANREEDFILDDLGVEPF